MLRLQIMLAKTGSLLFDLRLEEGSSSSGIATADPVQLASLGQTLRQLGQELSEAGPLQTFRVDCPPPESGEGSSSSSATGHGHPRAIDAVCAVLEPNLVALGYIDAYGPAASSILAVQHRLHVALAAFQQAFEGALSEEVYPSLGTKGIGEAASKFRAKISASASGNAAASGSGVDGAADTSAPTPAADALSAAARIVLAALG